MGWVLFALLLLLLIINVPVAISLGLSAVIVLWIQDKVPLLVIIQKMFAAADSFPLMAVPFFILAGKLMETGGISQRLVRFASTIVGRLHGGLGIVSVIACVFFAAISGSSAATTAAIGGILIPSMVKKGYDKSFAAAIQAAGGTTGIMIPPSVPLILFGVATGASISDLFLAGVGPGLLVGFSLALLVYFISIKRGYGAEEKSSFKDFAVAFKDAILALLMPIIILGGIYGGVFTPTEAAVVAVVYGLIVGMFYYKEIKWRDLPTIFSESIITTAVIMFIIVAASVFGYLLSSENVPQNVSKQLLSITDNPIIVLLLINIILLIVGTFLDTASSIIILAPILAPIATGMGVDLVHFGVIMIVNLGIGVITPPVGIDLFVASNIAKVRLELLVKAIVPFILVMIVDLLLISYLPSISMFFLK